MRWVFPGLLATFLSACVSAPSQFVESEPQCAFDEAQDILTLVGSTDQFMLDCVTTHSGDGVTQIRIDSPGGRVDLALDMAEIIADWDAHIVVTRLCASSCANYFLPVARRITVEPGAGIVLHGSIDQGLVDRADERVRANGQETADRQSAFAERFGVDPGWLLLRTAEEYESRSLSSYLTGSIEPIGAPWQRSRAAILVEERMIRTCLTVPDIDPFVDTLTQRIRDDQGRIGRQLASQGVVSSGSIECLGEGYAL